MTAIKPIALVTGASGGIGQSICERLGQDGYHVLIHFNKNASGAETALKRVIDAGGTGEVLSFDITDSKSVEEKLDSYFSKESGKQISALVNNAGIHNDTIIGLMSDETFDSVVKTNLYGSFYLLRWAIKKMLRARAGAIVNVSSLAGQTGNAGQVNYAAAKAGLIAMTKSLAMEVGTRGIRVNAVAPGLIETEMVETIPQIQSMIDRIPLKRMGKPEEVAGAVSFLISKDAGYITGHTISINGGLFPS
ncbi:MAG: 3-oxoacyl-ACP reductase FabG [Bdellovibrionales bacterium]|nr:3-oxoacyl-ACP reductase FabG [Bdellovibrionales bacterium]